MQEFYKISYTTKEFYHLVDNALESMKHYKVAKKEKLIDDIFQEKIMLAVTEVNGCEICNVYHTKNATKVGVSEVDINKLHIGKINIGTTKEDLVIAFAKDYASKKGNYSIEKFDEIIKEYGLKTAKGILGAIRIIMMGNANGIAAGALMNRLKFKPVKNSKLLNELAVTFSIIIFIPILGVKHSFKKSIVQ